MNTNWQVRFETLALVLATGLHGPGRALAGGPEGSPFAPPGNERVIAADATPGSVANPIPVFSTEVRASRLRRPESSCLFSVGIGPVRAALYGVPGTAPHAGGVLDASRDGEWSFHENARSGVMVNLGLERSRSALFVDGDRVLVNDPLETLARGDDGEEYWTTAAGVEVHF